MKIKKTYIYLYVVLLFIIATSFQLLVCTDIGSDTSVDRFTTQQILSDGDRVAGFAALEGGFALSSASTIATFDSFFPVSGTVALNGGTLVLDRDLLLHNTTSIQNLGNIVGGGHVMSLAPNMSFLPENGTQNSFELGNLELILTSNITLQDCTVTFTGNSVLNGQGHCLNLASTSSLLVGENSSLLIKNIIIKGLNDQRMQGTDSTSTFLFKNVELVLDGDFTFQNGHFDVLKELKIAGKDHTFTYLSDQVSTVSACGSLILDHGITFSYAPSIAADNLLQFSDNTAHLKLQSATVHAATSAGLILQKGLLLVDGLSFFSSESTLPSEGITLGDGTTASNNFEIDIFAAAHLGILKGHVGLNNV